MRIACLIIAAVAFLSAALQYNDPDPMLWGAYYLGIGLFAVLSAAGFRLRLGFISLVIASVSLLMSTWPGVQQYLTNQDGQTLANAMSKEFPYIEQTREFGGAILGLLCSIFCFSAAAFLPRPTGRRRPVSGEASAGP
ncbi:MAG: transmembrane 220 family protein [Planctomycetota bacterium]|jgi:membrane protein implicated in regulation of membrane protease activity|nr:transmembrane 220 family protein [Blastopirellula sp.]